MQSGGLCGLSPGDRLLEGRAQRWMCEKEKVKEKRLETQHAGGQGFLYPERLCQQMRDWEKSKSWPSVRGELGARGCAVGLFASPYRLCLGILQDNLGLLATTHFPDRSGSVQLWRVTIDCMLISHQFSINLHL